MPKFFIPLCEDDDYWAESTYADIISYTNDAMGLEVRPDRIYEIEYSQDGVNYRARVGQAESQTKETVVAILLAEDYLICTANRGVIRGLPIPVGQEAVLNRLDFEP